MVDRQRYPRVYDGESAQPRKPKLRAANCCCTKREIAKFAGKASQQGYTLIPLRLYFKQGRAKIEIAVARGKKMYDKREVKKKADAAKEIRRAAKDRRR